MATNHPLNKAAWLRGVKKYPLEVAEAPYTEPGPDEIVIRVRAVALNPVDYMTQHQGNLMFPWIKYPFILGSDVAGEVVQIGSQATNFIVGDRVAGFAASTDEKRNRAAEGGFQVYSVVAARMATRIPDSMTWEQAAVLPMGVTTCAAALFKKDQLGLRIPTARTARTTTTTTAGADASSVDKDNKNSSDNKETEKEIVIVWGGSTSVGCNAIQLAVAAGYDVLTTCSPRNNDTLTGLGAARCFDYRSESVVSDIAAACEGRRVVGAVAIGHNSGLLCMDVLGRCGKDNNMKDEKKKGGKNRKNKNKQFVSMVSYPMPDVPDPSLPRMMFTFMWGNVRFFFKSLVTGCRYNTVFSSNIMHDEVGGKIWNEFLGKEVLGNGGYKPVPEPEVVGHGLESVQSGLDVLKKGVSCKKLVVVLD